MTRKELFESETKASTLLSHALTDLKLATASGAKVDMFKWIEWDDDLKPTVCLAGAIALISLQIEPTKSNVSITSFGLENRQKLFLINSLRCGSFYHVSNDIDGHYHTLRKAFPDGVTPYNKDAAKFYEDMERMVVELDKLGL